MVHIRVTHSYSNFRSTALHELDERSHQWATEPVGGFVRLAVLDTMVLVLRHQSLLSPMRGRSSCRLCNERQIIFSAVPWWPECRTVDFCFLNNSAPDGRILTKLGKQVGLGRGIIVTKNKKKLANFSIVVAFLRKSPTVRDFGPWPEISDSRKN